MSTGIRFAGDIQEGTVQIIVIGSDPHKRSYTFSAVVSGTGELRNGETVQATSGGHEQMLAWARGLDAQRMWAIEDCRHVSGKLERSLRTMLGDLGLRPKETTTQIVQLRDGGPGINFLGFHRRWVRGHTPRSRHASFLARWPSRQAMQRARERVRELTARDRLRWPVGQVVQTSTGSCVAARAISATATRRSSSTRSSTMRIAASRC